MSDPLVLILSDWEIHADTDEKMIDYLASLQTDLRVGVNRQGYASGMFGFNACMEGVLNNGTTFSINYYKTKQVPTGGTTTDVYGNTVPVYAPAAGLFAIMRWISSIHVDPAAPAGGSGVTIQSPLPSDSPVRFA
jgi:hypothetical protein